jgi:hypothetical protein
MNKTIEVNDILPTQATLAKEQVKDLFERYMQSNTPTSFPDLCDLDESGEVNCIIDSCTPIYNWDIKVAWLLHESEILQALDNEGFEDSNIDLRSHDAQTGLYAYIYSEVRAWYDNEFKDAFEEQEVNA